MRSGRGAKLGMSIVQILDFTGQCFVESELAPDASSLSTRSILAP